MITFYFFLLGSYEFAAPGTYDLLPCKGRPCAKCGKCRDWYFTGDARTLTWLRNVKDWGFGSVALCRWNDHELHKYFKRRTMKICGGNLGGNIFAGDDHGLGMFGGIVLNRSGGVGGGGGGVPIRRHCGVCFCADNVYDGL